MRFLSWIPRILVAIAYIILLGLFFVFLLGPVLLAIAHGMPAIPVLPAIIAIFGTFFVLWGWWLAILIGLINLFTGWPWTWGGRL